MSWSFKKEQNQKRKFVSPGGGIGRRSRLKICHSQGCEGSIPFLGTKPLQVEAVFLCKYFYVQVPCLNASGRQGFLSWARSRFKLKRLFNANIFL
jgi:hypothetical protein